MSSELLPPKVAFRTQCPDCQTTLQAIKLIDRSNEPDREPCYTAADAQRKWYTGHFPVAGKVKASMCPSCGMILLHAEPNGD